MKNLPLSSRSKQIQQPSSLFPSYIQDGKIYQWAAQESYRFYCQYSHHGNWKAGRHHKLICDTLQQVEAGELDRVMFFMPPRHGKSMTISETFPSWFISKEPDRRVIAVAYGDSLAKRFGRFNRQKIEEFGPELFGLELAKDSAATNRFDIAGHRGGMIATGMGGSITGQGADLLLIDDPYKNRQQAESETYREFVWNEWQNTLLTRLHPGGAVIIVCTRWHEDDLPGRLLKEEPERWHVVSLAAEAEQEDPLGRAPGEPLWPEHGFDSRWIEDTKTAVGSQAWASLFQQRPSPAEGNMIKRAWWKFYTKLPPSFDMYCQSWDMTFKDTKESDYVVGQVWARRGGDAFLLDQVRAQMNFPETLAAVRSLSGKWPLANAKYVEDKANGPAVISMLQRELPGLIAVEPEGSKIARASAVSPFIEAGNVWLPHPSIAPWVHDYIQEFAEFPKGKNDDQVDSTTQALRKIMGTQIQMFF